METKFLIQNYLPTSMALGVKNTKKQQCHDILKLKNQLRNIFIYLYIHYYNYWQNMEYLTLQQTQASQTCSSNAQNTVCLKVETLKG